MSEQLLPAIRNCDVVHVHQWESVVANAAVLAGVLLGKPVFATDHGGQGPNFSRQLRLHALLSGFLPVSEFGATFYPELRSKTTVLLGGVDSTRFHPQDGGWSGRALFVGRLLPHKGISSLIRAIPPEIPLTVVGRPYDKSYFTMLEQLASDKDVTFVLGASDSELVKHYQSAGVAVLPSLYSPQDGPGSRKPELLGLTLLEAMSCGTPVICTRVGGMPELVVDDENGFVVEPGDQGQLTNRIRRALEPETRARLSDQALAFAGRNGWDTVADRCLNVYRRSVGRGQHKVRQLLEHKSR